jgi:hypothetical protein|tara:strand:- start:1290 stop:1583 length:294 start_codon:yes stop_codon:yes gene_type:complete
MKYLIDKKWFKENGSDSVEINRGGKTSSIEVTADLRMSDKFLGMLHSIGKPYVYLTDEAPKKVAPINKSKKVKKDEPRKVKEELQEEVSTETNEEGE